MKKKGVKRGFWTTLPNTTKHMITCVKCPTCVKDNHTFLHRLSKFCTSYRKFLHTISVWGIGPLLLEVKGWPSFQWLGVSTLLGTGLGPSLVWLGLACPSQSGNLSLPSCCGGFIIPSGGGRGSSFLALGVGPSLSGLGVWARPSRGGGLALPSRGWGFGPCPPSL